MLRSHSCAEIVSVSDPHHLRYGRHLTRDEVNQLIQPTKESIHAVHEWLFDNEISQSRLKYSPASDWISVTLAVHEAEKLLDTKFSVFVHEDGSHLIRTPQWSLPVQVHAHVQTIQPTTTFFRSRTKKTAFKAISVADSLVSEVELVGRTTAPKSCNASAVTSTCLRSLYGYCPEQHNILKSDKRTGTIDYSVQSASNNSIGLTNYLGEANNRSDVFIFLDKYRPEAKAAAYDFIVDVIANGDNQQSPNNSTQLAAGKDKEGNLDAETILGMTWPTNLTAYNTGGSPQYIPDKLTVNNTNEPYLTWLQYILAQPDIPQVISTSYGDDEQTVPLSYATAVCNGFAQLGARGVSVLFASGDQGVGAIGDCVTNDGKNTTTFLPQFPGSCVSLIQFLCAKSSADTCILSRMSLLWAQQ